ncbi:MAG TPA: gliding motility-associated C-terminal domain-containing protein, partial [Saprospiraceae bacterium]|nr:gliding motility-associated C-terminal domain-containing protein [Saprospiraceae bacterium]
TAEDIALDIFLDEKEIFVYAVDGLSWGDYDLLIRDEYGCEVRQRIDVERNKCPFYLPNIISGHSSSINNNFIIKTLDDYNLNVIKYRIYDRWGNLVYISGGFSVHDNDHWWNGYFNDKEAVSGVYCYVIEVQHPNGDTEFVSGDVTLIR